MSFSRHVGSLKSSDVTGFFLSDSCWISPERNALLAFVIPVAGTVLVSYSKYLSELKIGNKQTDRNRMNKQTNKLRVPIITTVSKLHRPANYN